MNNHGRFSDSFLELTSSSPLSLSLQPIFFFLKVYSQFVLFSNFAANLPLSSNVQLSGYQDWEMVSFISALSREVAKMLILFELYTIITSLDTLPNGSIFPASLGVPCLHWQLCSLEKRKRKYLWVVQIPHGSGHTHCSDPGQEIWNMLIRISQAAISPCTKPLNLTLYSVFCSALQCSGDRLWLVCQVCSGQEGDRSRLLLSEQDS